MYSTTGIGDRLRGVRGQLTQAEFSARLGVHRKTVERWESGERIPDGESLLSLKREFGIDPGWLLTGEGDRPSTATLSPDESELLALFRAAPLAVKAAAIGALQGGAQAGAGRTNQVTVTATGRGTQAAGRKIVNKGGRS